MELSRITYPITFSGRTFTVDDLRNVMGDVGAKAL
jgi:hypothetical protein